MCIFLLIFIKIAKHGDTPPIFSNALVKFAPCFYNPNGSRHTSATANFDNTYALAFQCKMNWMNNFSLCSYFSPGFEQLAMQFLKIAAPMIQSSRLFSSEEITMKEACTTAEASRSAVAKTARIPAKTVAPSC